MADNPTQTFADALLELESSRDVDTFVAKVFTEDAHLARPETGQDIAGAPAATQFWTQYLDQFEDVHSEFARIVDGEVGVLEWTSRGRLADGRPVDYSGVSLLDFDADGRVTRFATYYDTTPFQPR